MLLIYCPYCQEERSELEFRGAGDAHIARPTDIASISDEEFEAYFFLRDNPKGLIFERWRHIHGCGRFFNAARDTVTDKFIMLGKAIRKAVEGWDENLKVVIFGTGGMDPDGHALEAVFNSAE